MPGWPDLGDRMPRIRALIARIDNLADKFQTHYCYLMRCLTPSSSKPFERKTMRNPKMIFSTSWSCAHHGRVRSAINETRSKYKRPVPRCLDKKLGYECPGVSRANFGWHDHQVRTLTKCDHLHTSLMKIYSNAGAVEKSDNTVSGMVQDYQNGNRSIPTKRTGLLYNTAFSSWARSNRPDAVDRVIRLFCNQMRQHEHGNTKCRPNEENFFN